MRNTRPFRAIFSAARNFFEPEIVASEQEPKELLRRLVNVHIAPSPLCRAAYTERVLKAEALNGTEQYVILGAGLDTFAEIKPHGNRQAQLRRHDLRVGLGELPPANEKPHKPGEIAHNVR